MSKNLQNVYDMLKGEHKSQKKKAFNFDKSSKKNYKDYQIGDTWNEYDVDGNVIAICTKKEGYIYRQSPMHKTLEEVQKYLNTFPNCQKDKCTTTPDNITRIDTKYRLKMGMCSECACRFEDDIRLKGKKAWEEYEKSKMLDKANSIFKTSDVYLEELLKPIKQGYFEEIATDGKIIKHPVDPSLAEEITNEYNEYKRSVYETI